MLSELEICVAVLAAGQSRRFGENDKLAQLLHGKMLGLHICDTMRAVDFAHRMVVASSASHPCVSGWRERGFEIEVNHRAADGLGTSVSVAAEFAVKYEADALLIVLADMPFVPASHISKLISTFTGEGHRGVVMSHDGEIDSPPAIFGAAHFPELARLNTDKGARRLFKHGIRLNIAPGLLADIYTEAQLKAVRDRVE